MPESKQSYSSHSRFDPHFHFFLVPISAIMFLALLYHVIFQHHDRFEMFLAGWMFLFVASLFKTRLYALRNQDRIIRLEETVRLAGLAPDLRPRLHEVTSDQFIALRFAPDAEAAALCKRALDEKLSRDDIKKAIKDWRGDYMRI